MNTLLIFVQKNAYKKIGQFIFVDFLLSFN